MSQILKNEILYDLKVKHTRFSPVHVIGHVRSGTSILLSLIRKYLKVNFGTESQFIIRYYNNLERYGDLTIEKNYKLLINNIAAERCFRRWNKRFGFTLNKEKIFNDRKGDTYRDILFSIFSQFAEYNEMKRWGDNTPEYIYNLPVLKDLFPDAQFIHIVRDGRDVTLSSFKTHFGAKNAYKGATSWVQEIDLVRTFAATLPKEQYIEIKYEDLLTRPVDVFTQLINFLGIEDPKNLLADFINKNIYSDLKLDNFDKWKTEMTPREQFIFEKIAFNHLQNYNYKTFLVNSGEMCFLKKVYWEIDHFTKKITTKGYWRDNLYKLKLRLHPITFLLKKWLHNILSSSNV